MTHSHDDIRVGAVRLPFIAVKKGWLMPSGEVITNPFKAERLAEMLNNKRGAS